VSLSALQPSLSSQTKRIEWLSPGDGYAEFNLSGDSSGTMIKVYSTEENGDKTLVSERVSSSENEGGVSVGFEALAGKAYLVEVEESIGEQTNELVLSFNLTSSASAPGNDHFSNRIPLAGEEVSVNASLVGSTSELGEPFHVNLAPPQKSVWWKWAAPSDGNLTLVAGLDSLLSGVAVYAGWDVNDLIAVGSLQSDSILGRSLVLEVKQGVEYAIVVAAYGGDEGDVTMDLSFSAAGQVQRPENDDLSHARELAGLADRDTASNTNSSGEANEPEHGTNSSPINSIWWKWRAIGSGVLLVDTHGSDLDTVMAVYEGERHGNLLKIADNDDHEESTSSQILTTVEDGKTYSIAVDGFQGTTGEVVLNLSFTPFPSEAPPNDKLENATTIVNFSLPLIGSNRDASGKSGEPMDALGAAPLASVWWKWTADRSSPVAIDTLGSDFDTILALCKFDENGDLVTLDSNDDNFGTSSLLWFTPVINQTYYVAVDGKGHEEGLVVLNVRNLDQQGGSESLTSSAVTSIYLQDLSGGESENLVTLVPREDELAEQTVQYELTQSLPNSTYKVWKWHAKKWEAQEGAESLDGVKIQTNGVLPGVQGLIRKSGAKAFHLEANSENSAWLHFDKWLYAKQNSSISWWEILDDQAGGYSAKLEYSLDGELTWQTLFETQASSPVEFDGKNVSLAPIAGKVAKIRFHLSSRGSSANKANWYIDDIEFKDCSYLVSPQSYDPSENLVSIPLDDSSLHVLFAEKIGGPPIGRYSQPQAVFPKSYLSLIDFLGTNDETFNWRFSDWYGYYYLPANSYWFYSLNLGWQYFGQTTLGGGWLFDPELKWLWTSSNIYPWLYQHSRQQWIYDYSTPSEKRIFYDLSTKSRME